MLSFFIKKLIVLFVFFFISCLHISAQSFTLKGKINNLDTTYTILEYIDNQYKTVNDTIYTSNGKYEYKGNIKTVSNILIKHIVNGVHFGLSIALDTGTVFISYDYDNMDSADIVNSPSNTEIKNIYKPLQKQLQVVKSLYDSSNAVWAALKEAKIPPEKSKIEITRLSKLIKDESWVIDTAVLDYIKAHPNSYGSLFTVLVKYSFRSDLIDWVKSFINNLTEQERQSSLGNNLVTYHKYVVETLSNNQKYPFEKLTVGAPAPEFTIYTKTDSLGIKDLKGKVILLEFWSLNCLPCLQFNPSIEKLRKKYEKKGFEVVGITGHGSSSFSSLSSYIQKNKLSKWQHISTDASVKGISNQYLYGQFDAYANDAVPSTIIIDRKGNIVYKHLGFETSDLKEFEKIVAEIIQQ